MSRDVHIGSICKYEDEPLWDKFVSDFVSKTGRNPSCLWTTEEVNWWYDSGCPKDGITSNNSSTFEGQK